MINMVINICISRRLVAIGQVKNVYLLGCALSVFPVKKKSFWRKVMVFI